MEHSKHYYAAERNRPLPGTPPALTNAAITAGAAVLCDCPTPRPIGRNAAISVADAMGAQPLAPSEAIPKSLDELVESFTLLIMDNSSVRQNKAVNLAQVMATFAECHFAAQPLASSAVPEGWQLVPIVPTREMILASAMVDDERESVWDAYLAAAPDAPRQEAQPAVQGKWVRCTPGLILAGIDCANTPRRAGDGTYSHDHFIAHQAAAPSQQPAASQTGEAKC